MHVQFSYVRCTDKNIFSNQNPNKTSSLFSLLRCEASGGRPVPEVSWWNRTIKVRGRGGLLVEGNDCVEVGNSWDWRVEHENGTGSAKSEINLVADRYHQDNILSCHVNTRALKVRL